LVKNTRLLATDRQKRITRLADLLCNGFWTQYPTYLIHRKYKFSVMADKDDGNYTVLNNIVSRPTIRPEWV
jgi:hypothetical protein